MKIIITKEKELSTIEVDGREFKNVLDYKLTSSAYNGTELELKIDIPDVIIEVESLTNLKSQS